MLQGENDAQNWMTQAAQRKNIEAETAQRQQQTNQLIAMAPVIAAKRQADILAAQNEIVASTAMQGYRAQWQSLKPQLIEDLAKVEDPNEQPATEDGTPDWEDKYHRYEQLQAKYGQLGLFPEGKPYYAMIETAKKNAYDMALRHSAAQAHLDAVNAAAEGRLKGIEDTNATRMALGTDTNTTRRDVAQTAAGGRVAAARESAGGAMARTEVNVFSKAANDYENAALKEQDPAKAQALMEKAAQFRAKADKVANPPDARGAEVSIDIPGATPTESEDFPSTETSGAAPAAASVAKPAAAPVAPTRVKKDATTVNVGGKTLPIFKDAKGRLAYKLDGHWVEVSTE